MENNPVDKPGALEPIKPSWSRSRPPKILENLGVLAGVYEERIRELQAQADKVHKLLIHKG